MPTIDEELEQLFKDCPMLLDENFKSQHPGIVGVAGFLNSAARTHYKLTGKFSPFDRVGVNNTADYISLVQRGNSEAIKIYETVRATLSLNDF